MEPVFGPTASGSRDCAGTDGCRFWLRPRIPGSRTGQTNRPEWPCPCPGYQRRFRRSYPRPSGGGRVRESNHAHHLTGGDLPLDDCTLDRLVAKNVLVYVDDPLATFNEFYRVIKPGGKAHAIEGDWGITLLEPVPTDDWNALLNAASHAFRNPQIGREMYGLAKRAGFSSVAVEVKSVPDTEGRFLNMTNNLAGYARQSGSMSEDKIQEVIDTATQAAEEGTILGLAPQFLVTAMV